MPREAWSLLSAEIEAFFEMERRRVFHLAYERKFRNQVLDAVVVGARRPMATQKPIPRAHVAFCIDEREESVRRHLEEIAPDVETFGIAGFFGVAMYYRGVGDAHYIPLCPAVVVPKHYVCEDAAFTQQIGRAHV